LSRSLERLAMEITERAEERSLRALRGACVLSLLFVLGSCSGSENSNEGFSPKSAGDVVACDGGCPRQQLTAGLVRDTITQGVAAASLQGVAATFAVVDRVGNVLAVYQMPGTATETRINGQIGAAGGLEDTVVPSSLAAISKAGTAAYLSSQGNAFSTRTANQIVQEHFNPGQEQQFGGPLFGVQFSQLICSDVNLLFRDAATGFSLGSKPVSGGLVGPRPLPLGLSADPGGLPLYVGGDLVGGIGVELDGLYTVDRDINDTDEDLEEQIAQYASINLAAPEDRRAQRIIVGGRSLRFTDIAYEDLEPLAEIGVTLEETRFIAVAPFSTGGVRDGAVFGSVASGVLEGARIGIPSGDLVNESGTSRFPGIAGAALPGGLELKASEVNAMLDAALLTAFRSRAAIRRPLDSSARVSFWIVDTAGRPIGFARTADAPVFGIDVALQKARAALLFSSADLLSALSTAARRNAVGAFNDYAGRLASFFEALPAGTAFSNRAVGNLARPFFVDGIDGNPPGPLAPPFPPALIESESWSPFNTGLQLDLVFERLAKGLFFKTLSGGCGDEGVFAQRLGNGIQIFPGSVPLYRGSTLIGAIGVSGDGIDQDDMVAFYGASRAGLDQAGYRDVGDPTYGFNAPLEIRADTLSIPGVDARLRYVSCPEAPFIGSDEQNVCGE